MNKMTLPTELEYNANTRNNYFKQEAKGNVSGQGETDDGLITLENSQEDELEPQRKRKRKKNLVYKPVCDYKELSFAPRMIFQNKIQVKEAIKRHVIIKGYNVNGQEITPTGWKRYAKKIILGGSILERSKIRKLFKSLFMKGSISIKEV